MEDHTRLHIRFRALVWQYSAIKKLYKIAEQRLESYRKNLNKCADVSDIYISYGWRRYFREVKYAPFFCPDITGLVRYN